MTNNLSERVKIILMKEEGYDVEFKRNIKGLSVDDLVAFANSPTGGTILVGVDETTDKDGKQIGEIVGCNIGDNEKLTILNKANDCQPSVDVEIYVENEGDTPFYRIEIPSGDHKPYSTFKGTYLTRGDGRNLPLNRGRLLNMFLEEQGETFISRFKKATEDLEGHIAELENRIDDTNSKIDKFEHNIIDLQEELSSDIHEITSNVSDLTQSTAYELDNIFESIKNTEELANETFDTSLDSLESLEKRISEIEYDIQETKLVTNAILEHFEIEHPYITRSKEFIAGTIKACYKSYKELIVKRLDSPTKQQVIDEFQKEMIEMIKSTSKHKEEFIYENVKATIERMDFSDLDEL